MFREESKRKVKITLYEEEDSIFFEKEIKLDDIQHLYEMSDTMAGDTYFHKTRTSVGIKAKKNYYTDKELLELSKEYGWVSVNDFDIFYNIFDRILIIWHESVFIGDCDVLEIDEEEFETLCSLFGEECLFEDTDANKYYAFLDTIKGSDYAFGFKYTLDSDI